LAILIVFGAQMKLFCLPVAAMQIAALLSCAAASADEPKQTTSTETPHVLPKVSVDSIRSPVDKSYRKMLNGMDLFEAKHALAPAATLRYKLLPRRRDANMDGIVLKVVGDSASIPVPVAPDHTFTLERNQQALDEDASVMPDRKTGSMTWRADIRTPGLPPDTRRLGDLRLECQVGIEAGLVSNERPIIGQLANFLTSMLDYCDGREVHYFFFSERPLFSVTMVAGTRKEILPVAELYAGVTHGVTLKSDLPYCDCEVLLDRTYFMPLGDRSWPDDTLVEFEYMDDGNGHQAAGSPFVARTRSDLR
jgi:hypothetical protein